MKTLFLSFGIGLFSAVSYAIPVQNYGSISALNDLREMEDQITIRRSAVDIAKTNLIAKKEIYAINSQLYAAHALPESDFRASENQLNKSQYALVTAEFLLQDSIHTAAIFDNVLKQ